MEESKVDEAIAILLVRLPHPPTAEKNKQNIETKN
jgi:hypothetical protein